MTPRDRLRRQLDDELRFHYDQTVAELRRTGLTPAQAEQEATRRFGNVEKWRGRILSDTTPRSWRDRWINAYARVTGTPGRGGMDMTGLFVGAVKRLARRDRGYAIAFVTSLALGLAAVCGAAAFAKRAFFDPLPYPDPDRLVTIRTVTDGRRSLGASFLVGEDLRASAVFTNLSADWGRTVVYEVPGASERVTGGTVTANYFDVLGIKPAIGTGLTEGMANEVVVSWSFFRRALSENPAAIGRSISLDGVPTRVVGVMPPHFVAPYLSEAEMWLLLDSRPLRLPAARGRMSVILQARLADGVTLADAQAYVNSYADQQRRLYPAHFGQQSWLVQPLQTVIVEPSRALIVATAAATALLMTIVLANIAGLAVARAGERRRHDAVRLALGASHGRLFLERLAESLTLAAVGTGTGLWLATLLIGWATRHQQQFQLFLEDVPSARFDGFSAVAGVGLGAIAAVVAALVPHRSRRAVQADELLGSGRGVTGPRLARLRSGLVVVQVTIALVLLVSAALLVRTIGVIGANAIGFDTEDLHLFSTVLPAARYGDPGRSLQFETAVLDRLRLIDGVRGATASASFATTGAGRMRVAIGGRSEAETTIAHLTVAPGFFAAVGVPLRAGADFSPTDTPQSPHVILVNEMMARRFWPEGTAVGARLRFNVGGPTERDATVIGVVGDVRQDGPGRDVVATAWSSTRQLSALQRTFAIRAAPASATLTASVRAAVEAIDPLLPRPSLVPIEQRLETQTVQQRFVMSALAVFSAFATLLSALGLYTVVSMTAQARRREFALRIALGAQARQVSWLVFRQSLWLVGLGASAGLIVSYVATGSLRALLYGVEASDPASIGGAVATVIVVGLLASVLPARRSMRTDPASVLKAN